MSVQIIRNEILNANITSLISDNGDVYFKAKDVAEFLGYSNTNLAIQRHVWNKNKFEWGQITGVSERYPQIQSRTLFLTEPGVYQLIFKSELPSAESFQDWARI